MAKMFADLWSETDLDGGELDWKWDEEEMLFRATGSDARIYTLKPTVGEFDRDDSEIIKDEDEEEDPD